MRLPIVRATLGEALGRKIVLWGWIASAVLVVLFGIAFFFLFPQMERSSRGLVAQSVVLGGVLTILGLYVGSFLAAFLAIMLAAGSVSSEADSGVLQAVVVRPLPRWRWYLERWAGLVAMSSAYVVVLTLAMLLVARLISGYEPGSLVGLLALLVAQVTFLVTVGMLISCRLSTVATGVVLVLYFGIAWLGGFIGWIGNLAQRSELSTIGTVVSLLAPSDELWKGASSYAVPQGLSALAGTDGPLGLPFLSTLEPSPWFVGWALLLTLGLLALGMRVFSRRDL
ncbi:MAG TPA: ABC transporter permease subunit [Propionibacteriaceae bacterium]|nr:ABC transporter permease subunit [Propionibacteriaceae bacterium]